MLKEPEGTRASLLVGSEVERRSDVPSTFRFGRQL
jgi:hypothetical protein